MKLSESLEKRYTKEQMRAFDAQRRAHEIALAPITFQVTRLMLKFGIFQMLVDAKKGLTMDEIINRTHLSRYSVQALLEASLTTGTILFADEKYIISKTGCFFLFDPLVSVNMEFCNDVTYLGMHRMEEALLNGNPEGLKVFGDWRTIYEGLSSLPEKAKKSWLAFDHYYSDNSFDMALRKVFSFHPKRLLDVGGNTGRWALRCVDYDKDVHVTIMDLPQQIEIMKIQIAGNANSSRIDGFGINILDEKSNFPKGYDAIWMSQFLDCFSESEITSIVSRTAEAMDDSSRLFVMETFWNRQRNDIAAHCLTQTSLYFSVMANGNSKMYHSDDMIRCINAGGLDVEEIYEEDGFWHSILVCKKTG